jgi:hypothetical protein
MNYFSIGYQMEKENSSGNYLDKYQIGNLQSEVQVKKNYLSQSVIENLIMFGFNLDQIMTAHKIYQFKNLDEGIFVMMKDNETGKYNHRYIKQDNKTLSDKKENNNKVSNEIRLEINDFTKNAYLNLRQTCFICGGSSNEHVDYDFKEINLILDLDNRNNNNNENNLNNENNDNDNCKNNISQNHQSYSDCKINLEKEGNSKNLFFDKSDNNNNIDLSKNDNENNNNIENKDKDKDNDNDNDIDIVNRLNKNEIEENISNLNSKDGKENIINEKDNNMNMNLNKKNNLLNNDSNKQGNSNMTSIYKNNNKKKALMRSEIIIDIDKETLLSFEDPTICTICFDHKNNGKNFTEFSCGHKFCKICIKSYLTTNIINGKVKFYKIKL